MVINSLILRGLVLAKDLPRPCRTLLMNMACCDCLSAISMIVNGVLLIRPDSTSIGQCTAGMGIQASLAFVSIFLSTLFPVNAYLSQLIPFQYRGVMGPLKVAFVSFLVWTVSVVLVSIAVMGQPSLPPFQACDLLLVYTSVPLRAFSGIYLICMVIMMSVFWKLYALARSHICKIVSDTHADQKCAINLSLQAKALKTVSLIVASFVIMYTPLVIYLLIVSFTDQEELLTVGHFLLKLSLLTLFLAKSVINPVVYAWKIPFVREVTHKLLRTGHRTVVEQTASFVTEKTTQGGRH
ncbi:G-protein coupled receptor 12-like [Liolophura sinensis]|uniref:G-protein coupled receptor 12-like n=1 Tax=Liolophura sinensis TaxID=3198878 RepID=UPI0031596DD4